MHLIFDSPRKKNNKLFFIRYRIRSKNNTYIKRQLLLLLLLILLLLSHPLGIMFYLTKSLRVRRNIEKFRSACEFAGNAQFGRLYICHIICHPIGSLLYLNYIFVRTFSVFRYYFSRFFWRIMRRCNKQFMPLTTRSRYAEWLAVRVTIACNQYVTWCKNKTQMLYDS